MGNMGHCKFQNTYQDLEECYEALQEEGLTAIEENSNQYEKPYIRKLIILCKKIAKDFENE